MTLIHRLDAAIGELASIQERLRAIVQGTEDNWKHSYVELRRQMQATFDRMSVLTEEIKLSGIVPDLITQYRERLSKLRHKTALHQASWPVVLIDPSDPAYATSRVEVRQAARDFIVTAKEVLAALRRTE
ncbi:MAG: hypothetical protein AB7U35_14105 [Sphingobium sp.]